jgi:hypothetical protein
VPVLETEAAASASAVIPPRKLLRSQTFKALHYRSFALLWIGMILSNVGTWVQVIAQYLLVLQLTNNSGLALGLISFFQAAPFLVFSLVGGSTADRVDKRRLLLVTQSLQIVYAFMLGALTITGLIQSGKSPCLPCWRESRSVLINPLDLRLFRGSCPRKISPMP